MLNGVNVFAVLIIVQMVKRTYRTSSTSIQVSSLAVKPVKMLQKTFPKLSMTSSTFFKLQSVI